MVHVIKTLTPISSYNVQDIFVNDSTMEGARDGGVSPSGLHDLPMSRGEFILDEIIVTSLMSVDSSEEIHLVIENYSRMTISTGRKIATNASEPEPVVRSE